MARQNAIVGRVRALCFDVFGTVVDWRGSVIRECDALAAAKGLEVDSAGLADAWRAGYQPAMTPVREGTRPYARLMSSIARFSTRCCRASGWVA